MADKNGITGYVVQPGDTFLGLDKRYGLARGSFQKANPGIDPARLRSGSTINNPAQKSAPSSFYPPISTVHGALMQESLNGRRLLGDLRGSVYHARGPLQIRMVFPAERAAYEKRRGNKPTTYSPIIDEVNDAYKTKYTFPASADNPRTSVDIFNKWLAIQAKHFYKRYGRLPTDSEYLRMWNGGPIGYRKSNTLPYVQAIEEKRKNLKKWNLRPGVLADGTVIR